MFVAVTTAANARRASRLGGPRRVAADASQQLGGALGLAFLTAVAASRTNTLLAAAIIATRTTNARDDAHQPATEALPAPAPA